MVRSINLFVIFAVFVSFTFISCEKEEITETPNQVSENTVQNEEQQKSYKEEISPDWSWSWGLGACWERADDCLDIVIIDGKAMEDSYDELDEVTSSNNKEKVAWYFSDGPWEDLFPGLNNEVLTDLQSGDYLLTKKADEENGDLKYFFASEEQFEEEDEPKWVLRVDESELE